MEMKVLTKQQQLDIVRQRILNCEAQSYELHLTTVELQADLDSLSELTGGDYSAPAQEEALAGYVQQQANLDKRHSYLLDELAVIENKKEGDEA